MIEVIGNIGAILLSACAIPQLYTTFTTKNVQGLSVFGLLTWGFGCIFMTIYVVGTTCQIPLLINYSVNSIIVSTITLLYFKYKKNS